MAELKKILEPRKNRIAILIVGTVSILLIVFWQMGALDSFWPGKELLDKEVTEIKKLQGTLQKELNDAAVLKHRRDLFASQSKDYWVPLRDGKAETEVHKAVEQAARLANLKLSSLGDIRNSKINDGLLMMDLSISSTDSMENTARFLSELYRSSPRFYWQRCTIRPDNLREPKNIVLSGNLKFVLVSDEQSAAFLTGGKK